MLKYAKALVARAKVYYITGNHERRLENFDELMDELSKVGFVESAYITTRALK